MAKIKRYLIIAAVALLSVYVWNKFLAAKTGLSLNA